MSNLFIHTMKKLLAFISMVGFLACEPPQTEKQAEEKEEQYPFLFEPLVKDMYTADPSAHVFQGKIYIYPSHDIDSGIP